MTLGFLSLRETQETLGFLSGSAVKNLPAMQETQVWFPESGRSPGGGHGNPLSTLAWRIPWAEEPEGLQSMELKRVGHDWATEHSTRPDPADRHPSSFLGGQSLWLWHLFLHGNFISRSLWKYSVLPILSMCLQLNLTPMGWVFQALFATYIENQHVWISDSHGHNLGRWLGWWFPWIQSEQSNMRDLRVLGL